MDVRLAETERDLDAVRRLFRSFLAWQREQHLEAREPVDASFEEAAWEAELAGLPGPYGPPDGVLLLAAEANLPTGCVAARRLDDEACETERMFVAPVARGRGTGRLLAESVVERARAQGYRRMYLDTSVRQTEAIELYRSLGFVAVPPYHDVPEAMRDRLLSFRLDL